MKNKEIIKQLKKYPLETEINVKVNLNKHSLGEHCSHDGEWNGYSFTCSSFTSWKRGTLEDVGMTVEILINVLKKKELNELTSEDFVDLQLIENSDGDVDVDDIEWIGDEPTEEELEDLNHMDLYMDSSINDSEYEFVENSVYMLEVTIGDETIEIN
jgi:hypothetical protein